MSQLRPSSLFSCGTSISSYNRSNGLSGEEDCAFNGPNGPAGIPSIGFGTAGLKGDEGLTKIISAIEGSRTAIAAIDWLFINSY
jgi:hypothetical protein